MHLQQLIKQRGYVSQAAMAADVKRVVSWQHQHAHALACHVRVQQRHNVRPVAKSCEWRANSVKSVFVYTAGE